MESKICTKCNLENNIEYFQNKNTKGSVYKSNKSLKRYYDNKDELSNKKYILWKK